MKILLLSPPAKQDFYFCFPLSLGYLASVLERDGHEVNALDMTRYSWEKAEDTIKKLNPDVIGITCMTDMRHFCLKLASIAKKINKDIKIIFGGQHPTFLYKQILSNKNVDIVVMGEGEVTISELIGALAKNGKLKNIRGIAFKENNKIIKTASRPFIEDLDSIPFPAHRFFNFDDYRPAIHSAVEMGFGKLRHSPITTSRGCPFSCSYCAISKFWESKFKSRSPENVADEIELLYNKYNVRHFHFLDNDFPSFDKKKCIEICDEISKRKLDIHWMTETRVDFVSKDVLESMKKAGCYFIAYGVESGSEKILKGLNKNIRPEQIIRAFDATRSLGFKTLAYLLVGSPNETDETINETIRLLKRIKPDEIGINMITVFPFTPLYELAKSKGFINDDYWLTDKSAPAYTIDYTLNELKEFKDKIKLNFHKQKGTINFLKRGIEKILKDRKNALELTSLLLRGKLLNSY